MNTRNRRRLYAFLGLFLIAILPFSMYKIVKHLSDDQVSLPPYLFPVGTDTTYDAEGKIHIDTQFHKVHDFQLTSQLDEPFDFYQSTAGHTVIAHTFFCSCTTICPRLTQNAYEIQKAFKKRDSLVRILSITIDPVHDSVPVIRSYSQKRHANHDVWYFLTGTKSNIYNIVQNELKLDTTTNINEPNAQIHSEYFVLIDRQHYIRGFYNGLDTMAMKRLKDDIALLSLENPKH